MKLKRILFSHYFICTILILAILWGLLSGFFPLKSLENRAHDWMAGFRPGRGDSPVAIVAIDNQSIDALGNWPWPRSCIARMIDHLSDCGASTMGIHLLFPGNEWNPGLEEVRSLRKRFWEEPVLKDTRARKKMDEILVQAEGRLDHDASFHDPELELLAESGLLEKRLRYAHAPGVADPDELGSGHTSILHGVHKVITPDRHRDRAPLQRAVAAHRRLPAISRDRGRQGRSTSSGGGHMVRSVRRPRMAPMLARR